MWGICLDPEICGGKLFQCAVEYSYARRQGKVCLLRPVSGAEIDVCQIKSVEKPPVFVYGERVSPVNHPEMTGEIEKIIWHFKNADYNYYISVNNKKKSKRYYATDLRSREEHVTV